MDGGIALVSKLLRARLRGTPAAVGVPQQREGESQRDCKVGEIPQQTERVGLRRDPAADDRIEQDHADQDGEEGDEPGRGATGPEREQREHRRQEGEHDGRARSVEAAERDLDHGRDQEDAGRQDCHVSVEALRPRQNQQVGGVDGG